MRGSDAPEIRALALFRDVAEESFEALMRGAYLQTFPPRVQIIQEGDAADFLPILVDGAVELFAGWEGRQIAIALLRPVTTIVLAASIVDRPYLMSGRTLEKSRIALVPSEDVRRVFREDRLFAAAIVAELAHDFRGAIRQIKNLKLRSASERLANYLLQQSTLRGSARFELTAEKRVLASLLGMTPENLSRAFGALRRQGVVVEGARVRLESPATLRRYARPSDLIDGGTSPDRTDGD